MDGDHPIERSFEVTEATLDRVFAALRSQRVVLEHVLLKPNMVVPGARCPQQASVAAVAEATVRCLRRAVPAAVPGVASRVVWKREMAHSSGWMSCPTTNRPSGKAAAGGMRHGEAYQEAGAAA
jgi:hypothetical protein